jgi:hypothetical protein
VTVHTTAASITSQVAFTANPSPITLAAGASVGVTTLSWNAPRVVPSLPATGSATVLHLRSWTAGKRSLLSSFMRRPHRVR